jgi:hypothetical protein
MTELALADKTTIDEMEAVLDSRHITFVAGIFDSFRSGFWTDAVMHKKGRALVAALSGEKWNHVTAILARDVSHSLAGTPVTLARLVAAMEFVKSTEYVEAFSASLRDEAAAASAAKVGVDVGAIKLEPVLSTLVEARGARLKALRETMDNEKDRAKAMVRTAEAAFDNAKAAVDGLFQPIATYAPPDGPDFNRACWAARVSRMGAGAEGELNEDNIAAAIVVHGGDVSRKHRLDFLAGPDKRQAVTDAAQNVLADFRAKAKTTSADTLSASMGRAGLQTA